MSSIKTLVRMLKENPRNIPNVLVDKLNRAGMLKGMSDAAFLKLKYRAVFHKKLDLKNPKTFNAKLQWLKLYDRKPEYTTIVDKYAVREHIADLVGSEYLIPLLGRWDSADEIDFDALPQQFVLKCNHDSGAVLVCKDKAKFDVDRARKKLDAQLKKNLFWWGREWPYQNVKPCIIAEKYMCNENGELNDYKFMCFGGDVKCSFVCSERFSEKGLHVTFFDRDWNVMPFERHYPSVKEGLPKPRQYEKMLELAQKLSENIPFVRVDFYEVDGRIYFGELTLYPGCGFEEFTPESWDETLGSWIKLPAQIK